jgi:hypothetical protein
MRFRSLAIVLAAVASASAAVIEGRAPETKSPELKGDNFDETIAKGIWCNRLADC